MGVDLATFLAVYGSLLDGDLTGWSIGGTEHTGISGSHGNYETDSSPAYADLDQYGKVNQLVMEQFTDLFNLQISQQTNHRPFVFILSQITPSAPKRLSQKKTLRFLLALNASKNITTNMACGERAKAFSSVTNTTPRTFSCYRSLMLSSNCNISYSLLAPCLLNLPDQATTCLHMVPNLTASLHY